HEVFRTGSTRINMLGVWTTLIFVMNTFVFVLIGLALPEIIAGLGAYSVADGIKYGLIVSAIIIVLRFLWVYPAAYIPRWLSAKVRQDPSPGWKGPLIISWAGMRGVVSLATALSIPVLMDDKTTLFPQRNLIIFITFVVIFITLVFQGLTLPFIIKWLKVKEIDNIVPEEEQLAGIQLRLDQVALKLLAEKFDTAMQHNELIRIYKSNMENEILSVTQRLASMECDASQAKEVKSYHKMLLEIYAFQRKELFLLRKEKFFSDEEIRKAEMQLDLNELKIMNNTPSPRRTAFLCIEIMDCRLTNVTQKYKATK
ncbi:MAG: Na+/H+ antiporter, partial [Pedobacter sp.]